MVPARLSALCELRSKRVVYQRLVIVRAVRDVGRASAARVHQVLCETGKKWCGDIWNVENCLRWAVFELCLHFRMAHEISRRPRLSWWQSSVWQTDNKQNWRLCCVSARTDPRKSALNNPWTLCQVSYGTCQAILRQELNMRRVAAKSVPRILTAEQKEWCLSVSTNMLQEAESGENFMGQIITGDEAWVYKYDLEMKRQSSQWKYADSPRPKKARQVPSKVKVMLIVFFDMKSIVHYEYVPQGQTVNQQFYLQVLKRLRLAVSRKRPQKLAAGAWALHHDNAPAHTAHSIQVFLASHCIPVVQQPPYSPDMAPCDFWLSPQLKTVLKGTRFEDIAQLSRMRRARWTPFQKTLSKNVSSSGRTAGRNVSAHKESILKIIKYF